MRTKFTLEVRDHEGKIISKSYNGTIKKFVMATFDVPENHDLKQCIEFFDALINHKRLEEDKLKIECTLLYLSKISETWSPYKKIDNTTFEEKTL